MTENSALAEIIAQKTEKLRELRSRGLEPYPHRFKKTHTAAQALALPAEHAPSSDSVRFAGRLVQKREMGKASFAHLQDGTGRLQVYLKKDVLGEEAYQLFKKDAAEGDFLGVAGPVFKTKTGETTVEVRELALLSKALRPLPEKWHGLKDTELRQRHRHLDLLSNPEARDIFARRSRLIAAIRSVFDGEGFLEVETPVLTPQAGGATATPFVTHHKALDMQLYLRIALELYLKRLIIGGLDRVYEMGRVFRNEGIDTRHNPEFTMLEAYQAYADYNTMADLVEKLFSRLVETFGVEEADYRGMKVPLKPPFDRLSLPELWKAHCGSDIHEILEGKGFNRAGLVALGRRHHVEADEATPSAKIFERLFDARILPKLERPAFLMDHPTAITPLAKCKPGDESLVERFEFFIGGEELANAYTELNDPVDQRERFREQMRQRSAEGHEEAEVLDEDFVEALETGMPPTGGIGIGIDRLAMLVTGQASIREVVLFPTHRRLGEEAVVDKPSTPAEK